MNIGRRAWLCVCMWRGGEGGLGMRKTTDENEKLEKEGRGGIGDDKKKSMNDYAHTVSMIQCLKVLKLYGNKNGSQS